MSAPVEERPPLLLAIDTSTAQAGLALYDGDLLAEALWPAGRHGSQTLLVEVERLLGRAGRSVQALTGVAVALGPGSFSALRVGLSAAKGLAFALGCPLVGVPTLDVTAYPHRHAGLTVWAVVDAGRTRLAAAPYGPTGDGWGAQATPVHGPVAALLERLDGPALVCGELSTAALTALAGRAETLVPGAALRRRRPGCLAELAWDRLRAGQADDPVTLEPVYLHGSDA